MMFSRRPLLLRAGLFGIAVLPLLALNGPSTKHLPIARSPDDPALIARIKALSPTVSLDDAKQVTASVVNTGHQLGREWGVNWYSTMAPGIQNWLVKRGKRKGGYCYQYSMEVLPRLEALKLKTVEFHWAESGPGTMSENNGIVVTARGQPFLEGVLLDSWRNQPHVTWTDVARDPEYRWKENKAFAAFALQKANKAPQGSATKPQIDRGESSQREAVRDGQGEAMGKAREPGSSSH
jgi:hypothetical protein